MVEQADEATGITQRIVTENRTTNRAKKEELRPRLTLLDENSARKASVSPNGIRSPPR